MLGVISNSVGRSYGFPNEFAVSGTSSPMFEPRIRRHQVGYEARPEVSEVEDSIPSTRVRELAKTLESDSLVSYGWLSGEENVYDITFVGAPIFGVSFHGASWGCEFTLLTSAFEEWYTEYLLDTQTGEISGVEAQAIEQIKAWGIRDQVETALGIVRETFRSLYGYEVAISTDPEIPGRKIIRITLTVSGNPEDVYKDERRLKNRLYSVLDNKALELIAIVYHWEA